MYYVKICGFGELVDVLYKVFVIIIIFAIISH